MCLVHDQGVFRGMVRLTAHAVVLKRQSSFVKKSTPCVPCVAATMAATSALDLYEVFDINPPQQVRCGQEEAKHLLSLSRVS